MKEIAMHNKFGKYKRRGMCDNNHVKRCQIRFTKGICSWVWIDTLDWPSINILIDTQEASQLILCQHSSTSRLTVGQESTTAVDGIKCQLTHMSKLTPDQLWLALDWVLTKCQSRCQCSVSVVSTECWLRYSLSVVWGVNRLSMVYPWMVLIDTRPQKPLFKSQSKQSKVPLIFFNCYFLLIIRSFLFQDTVYEHPKRINVHTTFFSFINPIMTNQLHELCFVFIKFTACSQTCRFDLLVSYSCSNHVTCCKFYCLTSPLHV